MTDRRRLATLYLFIQSAVVPGWWIALAVVPGTRPWFFPNGRIEPALLAFVVPDTLVVAAGSFAAAVARRRRLPWAGTACWLVAGAMLYAGVFTIAWATLAQGPWLSPAAMAVAAAATLASARQPV